MNRQGFVHKWLPYGLALLPLLILELFVFPHVPFPWARPFLLPIAVAMVGLFEGISAGAAYGLLTGALAAALGQGSAMLFFCALVGAGVGYVFRYGLQQNFFGALLAAISACTALSLLRMLLLFLRDGASFFAPFRIAGPELLWSICFFPLIYGLYCLARSRGRRVSKGVFA